jgi:hypothetical protein
MAHQEYQLYLIFIYVYFKPSAGVHWQLVGKVGCGERGCLARSFASNFARVLGTTLARVSAMAADVLPARYKNQRK